MSVGFLVLALNFSLSKFSHSGTTTISGSYLQNEISFFSKSHIAVPGDDPHYNNLLMTKYLFNTNNIINQKTDQA
jgi:hypothetical protein